MTVKELRTLIDNLDEYIHVPGGIERLKKTVLHLAVSGQLVPQDPSEGTGEELHRQIQAEKEKLIKEGQLKRQKPSRQIKGDDTPFDIPRSWKWVRLGDVIELKSGADLVPSRYNDEGIGIPYITGASNIVNEQIIINRWTSTPNNLAEYGDLLITCKGTIGTMAFLNEEKAHIARQIMALKFSDYLDRSFVKYTISTKIGALQDAAQSIIPGIARKDMLDMVVALPSLLEQKRIVKKVEVIFALIDGLATRYKAEQIERKKLVSVTLAGLSRGDSELAFTHLTEIIRTKADASELRKTILHLAVSGQLVPQDPSESTGEDLYKQIQIDKNKVLTKRQKTTSEVTDDEKPFNVPSNWKWVRIGDIFQIRGGKRLPAGQKLSRTPSDHVYIRVTDMANGTVDMTDLHYVDNKSADEISRYIVTSDDLYLSIAGSIGKIGKIPQELSGSNLTENASRLTPYGNDANLDFYQTVIASGFVQAQFQDKKVQMAQPKLALFRIENSLIPLPPLEEQKRIVQKTTQLLDLVTELEKHLEK